MGPRAGLNRCGKSRPHRVSIPGPSSPQPVAIPTELPGPCPVLYRYKFEGSLQMIDIVYIHTGV